MNERRLPGIRFEAITMPVAATAAKFPGQTIPAIPLRHHRPAGLPAGPHLAAADRRDPAPASARVRMGRDDRSPHRLGQGAARDRSRPAAAAPGRVGRGSRGVLEEPEAVSALSLIARRLSTLLQRAFERPGGFQVRVHGRVESAAN